MTAGIAHQEGNVPPKSILLAPGLRLPIEIVTARTGILGETGSGKTTTAAVLVEELLRLQLPVDVIDPTDAWWGLKSSKDGKSEGYPVTVLGGDYGDVPLEETAGHVIADLIAEQAPPLVISLAHFTKGAMRRFLGDFAERLYLRNRRALHLAWDEADDAAPQNPQKMKGGGERLYGALDQIVRRGRLRGLGMTMISQRSAEINKSILSQCSVLIAHRASHPTDVEPVLDWMKAHAKARIEEVRSTIAALKDGEAWVMSPKLGIFDRYQMNDRTTFNSSATPEPGKERIVPKKLAKPDLDRLQEQMRDTIERAKANDPAALRRKVAELERELAKKPAAAPPAPAKIERVEVPIIPISAVKAIDALDRRLLRVLEQVEQIAKDGRAAWEAVQAAARAAPRPAAPRPDPGKRAYPPKGQKFTNSSISQTVAPARAARVAGFPTSNEGAGALGAGERRVLTAVAQHRSATVGPYPGGVTREQLTVLTGYKRSSRDTYLQRLRAAGLVVGDGEVIVATDEGIAALGPGFEPLPIGDALLEHWRGRLPAGELAVLEVAVRAYPEAVERDAITEATNYQRSSRDTYLQRLRSRQLITEPGRGLVRAAEALFG